MIERREIVELWRQGAGAGGVLVTLVRAEGSSYRRPGARLLIAGGGHAGTISGGCLEAEVSRKAVWMVRDGSVVERYSMLFDDTAEVPFGLGCGGVVDLLLEPTATAECAALMRALEDSLRGEEMRVATWLPGDGRRLRRAVFAASGETMFVSEGLGAAELQWAGELALETSGDSIYGERLVPPLRLMVCGAGDDARPMVRMAVLLGWSVTVTDGHAQMATAERFPEAERLMAPAEKLDGEIHAGDAVVIMTHSYEQDRGLLVAALRSQARYIGLLGSRNRSSLLVSEAAVMLGRPVSECCERIHAPVGLDLGGDGPEAIALAVIAEIQAVCEGRPGSLRRLSAADVDEQIRSGGEMRYLQARCALDAEK